MADVAERVLAEEENLRHVLATLPAAGALGAISDLELAGTAALLHSLYNGIENILKQVVRDLGDRVPEGASWHRDLLSLCEERRILNGSTAQALAPFMAFRHFFSHGYALDLEPARMEALVEHAAEVVSSVHADVFGFLTRGDRNARPSEPSE